VLLFIGASLEGLEQDLARLPLEEPTTRRHFALTHGSGETWNAVAERLKTRYGIEALPYLPSAPDHPEVVEFLTNLITAIREKNSSKEYFDAGE
jgi:hypothetical protein